MVQIVEIVERAVLLLLFFNSAVWNFVRMFALKISRSSPNMGPF